MFPTFILGLLLYNIWAFLSKCNRIRKRPLCEYDLWKKPSHSQLSQIRQFGLKLHTVMLFIPLWYQFCTWRFPQIFSNNTPGKMRDRFVSSPLELLLCYIFPFFLGGTGTCVTTWLFLYPECLQRSTQTNFLAHYDINERSGLLVVTVLVTCVFAEALAALGEADHRSCLSNPCWDFEGIVGTVLCVLSPMPLCDAITLQADSFGSSWESFLCSLSPYHFNN